MTLSDIENEIIALKDTLAQTQTRMEQLGQLLEEIKKNETSNKLTFANKPINSAFVFPEGTSVKMKDKKISDDLYSEIKRQSELLREKLIENSRIESSKIEH